MERNLYKMLLRQCFFVLLMIMQINGFVFSPYEECIVKELEGGVGVAEITDEDMRKLLESVPRYLSYYTENTVEPLTSFLNEVDNDNLNECTQNELFLKYNLLFFLLKELEYKSAEVPQIYITTINGNGNELEKEDGYIKAEVAIVEPTTVFVAESSIKVRGNSTALAPKKPFTIKFDSEYDILEMGKGKKWVLLANCYDPTLLRNYIAFDFATHMGLAYTSEKKVVELWLDGVFEGCYLLVESLEVGKDRIDITMEKGDFLRGFVHDCG